MALNVAEGVLASGPASRTVGRTRVGFMPRISEGRGEDRPADVRLHRLYDNPGYAGSASGIDGYLFCQKNKLTLNEFYTLRKEILKTFVLLSQAEFNFRRSSCSFGSLGDQRASTSLSTGRRRQSTPHCGLYEVPPVPHSAALQRVDRWVQHLAW